MGFKMLRVGLIILDMNQIIKSKLPSILLST